jgi:hypothetical protein
MQLPRMTPWQVMIATALGAVLFWATMALLCLVISTGPGFLAISAAIGGLFALGAMRHPWLFLAIAVAIWVATPRVFDSSAHDFFQGCYRLGWLWGAIVGAIVRRSSNSVGRRHSSPAGRTGVFASSES